MKIRPVVENEKKFYIPKMYVNSIELENNSITVRYYFRDILDENYDFNWFDDKTLLKNIRVSMALSSDSDSKKIRHTLYELMYDYKDVKVTPSDVDAFGERSYYFELSKKFDINTAKIQNCSFSYNLQLMSEETSPKPIIGSGVEDIQILKDGKTVEQFYYQNQRGEVYLGSVKQVGPLFVDINNSQLTKKISSINYTIKDLRNLKAEFPKFERIIKDTTIKNKRDIIYKKEQRTRTTTLQIQPATSRTVDFSKISLIGKKVSRNRFNSRFSPADLIQPNAAQNRLRDINSPEIRNRDLLTQESVSGPVTDFPQRPAVELTTTITDTVFVPVQFIDNNIKIIPDIFLSVTSDKKVHGLFAIDIDSLLLKNSEFYQYFYKDQYYNKKCLDNTLITNIKVNRYKIPKSEQEKKQQQKVIIASSGDQESEAGISFVNNESIIEVKGLSADNKKRYFTFSDSTILLDEVGTHYYEVEVEVSDFAKILLTLEFKDVLTQSIKTLQSYLDSVTLFARNKSKPLFPLEYFYETEYEKYKTVIPQTIQSLAYIYSFLTKREISEFVNLLSSYLHPLSTNTLVIKRLIESVKNLSSSTEKIIGYIDDITSEINSRSSVDGGNSKFIYTEVKKFDRPEYYVDLSYKFGTGVEFFDVLTFSEKLNKLNSRVGLLKLNEFQFTNRISREVNKYVDKDSNVLNGKNLYLSPTYLDIEQDSFNFIDLRATGDEFVKAFNRFYTYFGHTENVSGIGSLFNVLASKGVYISSIASKNNVSENNFFPSVVSDNNPDSRTSSKKYITDTRIDTLFISYNKNKKIVEQFKDPTLLADSYIGLAAKQKVVISGQQILSRFVVSERNTPEDYCRTLFTYGSLVKITEDVIVGPKYSLRKLEKNTGLESLYTEISKNLVGKSDILESKNIPVCDEYFLYDNGTVVLQQPAEKTIDTFKFNEFVSNDVKPEYMKTSDNTVESFESKIKSITESI